jgi:hypothetical protein
MFREALPKLIDGHVLAVLENGPKVKGHYSKVTP